MAQNRSRSSPLAREKHDLVFCFTEHFACNYNCQGIINQCHIITYLTLKSDNIAKSRTELKDSMTQTMFQDKTDHVLRQDGQCFSTNRTILEDIKCFTKV